MLHAFDGGNGASEFANGASEVLAGGGRFRAWREGSQTSVLRRIRTMSPSQPCRTRRIIVCASAVAEFARSWGRRVVTSSQPVVP